MASRAPPEEEEGGAEEQPQDRSQRPYVAAAGVFLGWLARGQPIDRSVYATATRPPSPSVEVDPPTYQAVIHHRPPRAAEGRAVLLPTGMALKGFLWPPPPPPAVMFVCLFVWALALACCVPCLRREAREEDSLARSVRRSGSVRAAQRGLCR